MARSRRTFLGQVAGTGIASVLARGFSTQAALSEKQAVACVRPREYCRAFANPLKGFRPDIPSPDGGSGLGLDNPLVTLARHYIRWNQIEDSPSDGVDKIMEFCDARWAGIEKRNLKVIPRVYLYWPEQYYWPNHLHPGIYGGRRFLHHLEKFILKLGDAWNRDGRVAYVETGIVGPCGEQWNPTPHWELRKVMGDTYTAAFPDKLCMIRYPWQWLDYQFGVFWDSWGSHKDTAAMLNSLESPELDGTWRTRVRGGEIPYGFGEPPGQNPNDTMTNPHHVDWVECLTRRGHWNHLGWVAEYNWRRPGTEQYGQRLQKAFGYRFVLEEVKFPIKVAPGGRFEVCFTVRNTGASPFYYKWPVTVSLLEESNHQLVWQETFAGVDIREWLPGDRWEQFANWSSALGRYVLDDTSARYQIPPVSQVARGQFQLPSRFRRGSYILALAILDPSSNTPTCRFANENYFNGGWHPVGRIGVDRETDQPELTAVHFDDIADDTTVRYER